MAKSGKSSGGSGKSGSGSASKARKAANVSVLKISAKTEGKGSSAKAGDQKNKKPQASAESKADKAAKNTINASEKTQNAQTNTGNFIKEKTMAKNSNNNSNININVPFDNFAKEAAEMSREYSEACVKSGTILMKGMEDFVGVVMSIAQSSAEKQAQFIKEAMSSKTINEFAEVQNKIAQANFDDFMAGATKLTEIGTKLLTDSAEPVNAQIGKAIKKASESVAA